MFRHNHTLVSSLVILCSCSTQTELYEQSTREGKPIVMPMGGAEVMLADIGDECLDTEDCDFGVCWIKFGEETGICAEECEVDDDCFEDEVCQDTSAGLLCIVTDPTCEEEPSEESEEGEEEGGDEGGEECLSPVDEPQCGNMIVESGEECDGEPECDDDCTWALTPDPECGNMIVEPGEECDGEPECGADCAWAQTPSAECGNMMVEAGEECDGGDQCSDDCTLVDPVPVCGNMVIEAGEECDGGDLCSGDCRLIDPGPMCGNMIVEEGEECDGGPDCTADCRRPLDLTFTEGDDTITGNDQDNQIQGGGGNDTLRGEGGDDRLEGGDGDDELRGGEGNDVLRGNQGADDMRGGLGDDRLYGGRGDDDLRGGGGVDHLYGGPGNDKYIYTPNDGEVHIYLDGGTEDILRCTNSVEITGSETSGDLRRFTMSNGGEVIAHQVGSTELLIRLCNFTE